MDEAAEEEDLLEVEEEAALIHAERFLVDAEPHPRNRKDRQRQEELLAKLADLMLAMNLDQIEEQPPQQHGQGQGEAKNEIWEVRYLWNSNGYNNNNFCYYVVSICISCVFRHIYQQVSISSLAKNFPNLSLCLCARAVFSFKTHNLKTHTWIIGQ